MNLQMTQYLRDSVAAKQSIDFKNNTYETLSQNTLEANEIPETTYNKLFGKSNSESAPLKEVMIVAKTIKTKFQTQQKLQQSAEDLTGVFFIPALITNTGKLLPPEVKLPWIPRENLYPLIEESLAIGRLEYFDDYMSDYLHEFKKCESWQSYYHLCRNLYEKTTEQLFSDTVVNGIELDRNIYIFKDDTINATHHILGLYDDLINAKNYSKSELYKSFISKEFSEIKPLIQNSAAVSQKHVGQMGGEYGLSPSQRESLNHFTHTEHGEILAVNGPPGTGKTTLLQTLVANLYVEKALKKEKAPLIVASSTNNQAVTNIIESFGKIKRIWPENNLENRWVHGVDSLAVYFPSAGKVKDAQAKGFHYTNPKGEHFFEQMESEENIQTSKKIFLEQCSTYFRTNLQSLSDCEKSISQRLADISHVNKELLKIFNEYFHVCQTEKSIDSFIMDTEKRIQEDHQQLQYYQLRLKDWQNAYKSIPFYYRWFKFIPAFKGEIQSRLGNSIENEETFLNGQMKIEEIIKKYKGIVEGVKTAVSQKNKILDQVKQLKDVIESLIQKVETYNVILKRSDLFKVENLEQLNEHLDITLRYSSFWLAVHYYEYRWLTAKRLSERQKGKNFENVLSIVYENLSMLTPCYVMTFYQLPKLLQAYSEKSNIYLYDKIDLLIVDEAGQVSPEIAACSFSLAKRAVVVGDQYQIEPVWNIQRHLDMSLAKTAGVISSKEEFDTLTSAGLNTSESSVMKVASKSSRYEKFRERGLFLSEHRRCYDEIIDYCNQLVYKGNLEPKRGQGRVDEDYKFDRKMIPHFGHYQIKSEQSAKRAGSRYNQIEAKEIVNWVRENLDQITTLYPDVKPNERLGIVTPFKAQVAAIKKELPTELKTLIDVGTVHTFQGGERKIIIMSTVYGKNEGCFFIDANKSLLNVAVSRAKDSFMVFGEIGCLSPDESLPSGLLKRKVTRFG